MDKQSVTKPRITENWSHYVKHIGVEKSLDKNLESIEAVMKLVLGTKWLANRSVKRWMEILEIKLMIADDKRTKFHSISLNRLEWMTSIKGIKTFTETQNDKLIYLLYIKLKQVKVTDVTVLRRSSFG